MKMRDEVKNKIRLTKLGKLNPNWSGDKVGYSGVHLWIRRNFKKPLNCQCCGEVKPLDLANISQKYKRDIDDFEWLCRRCHMNKDGRINNLKRGR